MAQLKITQCEGEGAGSCKRCSDRGKWNSIWCCFLYRVEGYEGCYCSKCVEEIKEENNGNSENKETQEKETAEVHEAE